MELIDDLNTCIDEKYSEQSYLEQLKGDMAAKRRKKHKNKISRLVISMCYNEQKPKF